MIRASIEWALWSKRNMTIAAVIFLFATWVVSAGLSVLTDSIANDERAAAVEAAPKPLSAVLSPTPTEALGDDHDDGHARASEQQVDAIRAQAVGFTRAWLDTTRQVRTPPAKKGEKPGVRTVAVSKSDWMKGLAGYIDAGLVPMLQATNLAAIPRGDAGPVEVREATPFNAQAVAQLPGGQSMTIGLTWTGRTWEVNSLTPGRGSE